jgi:hypothetical protein
MYVGNDIQGHLTAAIGLGSGTTSNYALNQGFAAVIGTNASVSTTPLKIRGFSDTVPLQEWGDGTGAVYLRVLRSAANVMSLASSSVLGLPSVSLVDGSNMTFGTSSGTKIGTATTEKIGFWNKAPVVRPAAYTPTNVTTDRSYDANATDTAELADVLGTLIADLQSIGLIG